MLKSMGDNLDPYGTPFLTYIILSEPLTCMA